MSKGPRSYLTSLEYRALFPKECRIVVFDIETTGLNFRTDEIIELGAVELEGGELGRTFRELAKPGCRIHPTATEVHGYTAEDLLDKQPPIELVANFMNWLGNTEVVLAGHNSSFDIGFLTKSISELNKTKGTNLKLPSRSLCTMKLINAAFDLKYPSLDLSLKMFQINQRRCMIHSALEDAQLTAQLLLVLMNFSNWVDTECLPKKRMKTTDEEEEVGPS